MKRRRGITEVKSSAKLQGLQGGYAAPESVDTFTLPCVTGCLVDGGNKTRGGKTMSWVLGKFTIDSLDKLDEAESIIRSQIRHNADLEEFPSMGDYIMPIRQLRTTSDVNGKKIYGCLEEAEDFIDKYSAVWSRRFNVYVPFYDVSKVKTTAAEKKLRERIDELTESLREYVKVHSVKNLKAELITCRGCKSKIRKDYLDREICPVCKEDLRAEYIIETIDKMKQRIKDKKKELLELEKKKKDKAPVRYLVAYEEYVG